MRSQHDKKATVAVENAPRSCKFLNNATFFSNAFLRSIGRNQRDIRRQAHPFRP
jgi:hypothetical protein